MKKITTFITFNHQAEEAVNFYISIFRNSKILSMNRYGEGGPLPAGTVISANFVLEGQEFIALNGGPHFTFSDGISLYVNCETQQEVDELWDKLVMGGAPGQCGWLKDKFGVSWQIIPTALGQLLGDPDPQKSQQVMQAMLKMTKIDVAALRRAYEQK
jgi:predicted 3-demethylubiquinone-9 3-methyltransferase (glyoxalase superfamily)